VHATRVELHVAVGVREAAESDARLVGVQFDDRDALDERFERIAEFRGVGHETKRVLDARLGATVPELVAVGRRNHDWTHAGNYG
jgi:hypothetical protein